MKAVSEYRRVQQERKLNDWAMDDVEDAARCIQRHYGEYRWRYERIVARIQAGIRGWWHRKGLAAETETGSTVV